MNECLFVAPKLTQNTDLDKYFYSGNGIGFLSLFLLSHTDWSKNVIIFGVDNSLSVHIENNLKDISILGKDPTKGLGNTTITAEAQHSINFRRTKRKFFWSLIIMEATFLYLLMLQNDINSKQKTLK